MKIHSRCRSGGGNALFFLVPDSVGGRARPTNQEADSVGISRGMMIYELRFWRVDSVGFVGRIMIN